MTNNQTKTFLRMLVFLLSVTVISFQGCDKDEEDSASEELVGNWFMRSDFEGVPRTTGVCFTIANKAYVGLGYDGKNRLVDFWEYDADLNNWTRKADFPGVGRNGAVGFSIGSKGYVGTGYDGLNKLKDFYEYDPATDTWSAISDFGGSARYGAVAFSIASKGYVSTGDDGSYLKDLWEYDPATDQWSQKVSLGGSKRRHAAAFVIDGKGYICTGVNNGVYTYDIWEYDPTTDIWSGKRSIINATDEEFDDDYTDIVGTNKVAFAINGKGYIATGGKETTGSSVWEYDASADLWHQKTSIEAVERMGAVGFAIGDTGYLATGRYGSYYLDDFWGFMPGVDQVDLDKRGSVVEP